MADHTHPLEDNEIKLSILDQIPTPVTAIDLEYNIVFMNPAGCRWFQMEHGEIVGRKCYDILRTPHCQIPQCRVGQAIKEDKVLVARNELVYQGKPILIEYTAAPLKNSEGKIIGGLEYIVDITERIRTEEILQKQSQTILELSLPAIKLWDGIVFLPLVGAIDTLRAKQIIERLLNAIVANEARVVLLDVTGVPIIDTAVAQNLMNTVSASRMLGAEVIITGISPATALTLTKLNVDLSQIRTRGSLKAGIIESFRYLNLRIESIQGK